MKRWLVESRRSCGWLTLAGVVALAGCRVGAPPPDPAMTPPQLQMPGAYGPQLIPGQPPSFPSGQPTLNPGPTAAPPVNELPAPTTEARAQTPRNNRLVEHGLAVKAMRQGRFAEADVHFLRAWDQGPPTAELLNDMGYRLYLERRFAEAESVYRQALFIEPHHVAATLNLGRVLARQGRIDESLAVFRQVNGEAEAEANVAYVLADYGSVETAVAHYGRSGEISVAMRSRAQNSVSVIARLPSSSPSDFPLGPQQDTTPVGGVAGAGGAMPPVTARITKVRPAVE